MDPVTGNPNPTNPNPTPAPLAGADGKLAETWLQHPSIPADLRADKTLGGIKDLPTLATMLVNGQKTIGRLSGGKGVALVPEKPDDQAGWDAFYRAAGRPETPDVYPAVELPPGSPADLTEDPEAVKQWRTWCHEAGLTPAQYTKLSQAIQAANLAAATQAEKAAKAAQDKVVADVKTELGAAYDTTVQLGNHAFAAFADAKMMAYAKEQGWLADPMFLRFCGTVGAAISPDRLHVHGGQVDTGSIQTKINELMASKEYQDPNHLKHRLVSEEVQRLYSQLHNAGQP